MFRDVTKTIACFESIVVSIFFSVAITTLEGAMENLPLLPGKGYIYRSHFIAYFLWSVH